jgi:hypothetical protein
MCARHYHQAYFAKAFSPRPVQTPMERFKAKVVVTPSGCHEWTGPRNNRGYGRFLLDGRQLMANRWLYQQIKGPIPAGMHLCHSCDNPPCVNLDHLWVGTASENMRDMSAKGRFRNQNTGKTHCVHGHEFTEANTYRYGTHRMCKTCLSIRDKEAQARRKAARVC